MSPEPPTDEIVAIEQVDLGDLAFAAGQRADAVAKWRQASKTSDHPAIVAMVALRRVRVEGTLAPLWQERVWTVALANCPLTTPICRLAHADRSLYVPSFAGGSHDHAAALIAGETWSPILQGAADQRATFARQGTPWLDHPGTWTTNLSLTYDQLSGVGAMARFIHPDVAYTSHRVDLLAYADFGGNWTTTARWRTPGQPAAAVFAAASNGFAYAWTHDPATPAGVPVRVAHGRGEATVAVRPIETPVRVWASAGGRYDSVASPAVPTLGGSCSGCVDGDLLGEDVSNVLGFGAVAASWSPGTGRFRASANVEAGTGDYSHLAIEGELRSSVPIGPFALAAQLAIAGTPLRAEPWWRWPSAGGAHLLRGLPDGRLRAPLLVSTQLEVSRGIVGPLHAAVFVDAAHADSATWTAGGGLRLVLPPGRDNTTRLDLGAGPLGWGAVLSWGEAF